jgi:hypothetical protein
VVQNLTKFLIKMQGNEVYSRIDLSRTKINDEGFSILADIGRDIRILNLRLCEYLTDAQVRKIGDYCPNLVNLYLPIYCHPLNKQLVIDIISALPKLEEVVVSPEIFLNEGDQAEVEAALVKGRAARLIGPTLFQGHTGRIFQISISDGKLYTSAADECIKVWQFPTDENTIGSSTPTHVLTYQHKGLHQGEDCWPERFIVTKYKVVSCFDKKMGIFSRNNGSFLEEVDCSARSLLLRDDKLYTGDEEGKIKIWDITAGKAVMLEEIDTGSDGGEIKALDVDTTTDPSKPVYFYGGWGDQSLRMCHDDGKVLLQLYGHRNFVALVQVYGQRIFTMTDMDDDLRIWDRVTGGCLRVLRHSASTRHFQIYDDLLYVSSGASIYVWNIDTGAEIAKVPAHMAYTTDGLLVHNGIIITGSTQPDRKKSNHYIEILADTELLRICALGTCKELIAELNKRPADLNRPDYKGYTPLHIAVIRGWKKGLQILLAAGSDPTLKTLVNKTALDYAAGNEEMAALLAAYLNPQTPLPPPSIPASYETWFANTTGTST